MPNILIEMVEYLIEKYFTILLFLVKKFEQEIGQKIFYFLTFLFSLK